MAMVSGKKSNTPSLFHILVELFERLVRLSLVERIIKGKGVAR
jgi:hypothetical protein